MLQSPSYKPFLHKYEKGKNSLTFCVRISIPIPCLGQCREQPAQNESYNTLIKLVSPAQMREEHRGIEK